MHTNSWLNRSAFGLLALLTLTFAFEAVRPALRVGGSVITNVEVLLLLVIVVWIISCLAGRHWPSPPSRLVAPVVAWLVVLALSTLLAQDHRREAWQFVARLLAGVLLGWAAYDLARNQQRWTLLIRLMAVSGVLVGLLGIAEAISWPLVDRWLSFFKVAPTKVGEVLRVSSTLGYATIASMVLELTMPLLLVWVMMSKGLMRLLLVVALGVMMAAQVLTLTRGGVLALSLVFGALVVAGWWVAEKRLWRASGLALAGLLALTVINLWLNPLALLRLASESEKEWYRATYQMPAQLEARPGEQLNIPITVENTGLYPWQPGGEHPFALSYHLFKEQELSVYDGLRTLLPSEVAPASSVALQAQVVAPLQPGNYWLMWDMVQEDVTWFSWKNPEVHATRLVVIDAPTAQTTVAPPADTVKASVPYAPVSRLTLWAAALKMWREHPWFGVGPDNFRYLYGPYAGLQYWDTNIHTNNLYLEWLVDTGVVGLLAFLWVAYRLLPITSSALSSPWQLGLLASLLVWFAHGLLDFFYEFTPTYTAFWLIAGLALRGNDADRL